ncbi:MAG: hypothetical protein WA906_01460, partial [Pacificimonas sp.]
VERVSKVLRDNGGDFAETAARQSREHPLALALTGAGLAWLINGPVKKASFPSASRATRPSVDYDDRSYQKVQGFRHSAPKRSFEDRIAKAEGHTYDPSVRTKGIPPMTTEDNPASRSMSLRDRLMEGTEMMTESARDRVIAAREAAIIAERRIEARAREYSVAGRDAYYSQPLMGALVAFGVGALAGALLPRTRTEDRHFGPARDRALAEAERMYHTEAARLRAHAEAVAEEALESTKAALRDGDVTPAKAEDDKTHPIN